MCLHFCVHLYCAASCVINDDDDDDDDDDDYVLYITLRLVLLSAYCNSDSVSCV